MSRGHRILAGCNKRTDGKALARTVTYISPEAQLLGKSSGDVVMRGDKTDAAWWRSKRGLEAVQTYMRDGGYASENESV
jgi:hypothetical protein